ncbi:MAG: hypothetical protein JNK45_36140, partial [Myxococcales bacterium]|nr:hypothetical protein [Myxococcales bacterium]
MHRSITRLAAPLLPALAVSCGPAGRTNQGRGDDGTGGGVDTTTTGTTGASTRPNTDGSDDHGEQPPDDI